MILQELFYEKNIINILCKKMASNQLSWLLIAMAWLYVEVCIHLLICIDSICALFCELLLFDQ